MRRRGHGNGGFKDVGCGHDGREASLTWLTPASGLGMVV